jgi:hypothetical protein
VEEVEEAVGGHLVRREDERPEGDGEADKELRRDVDVVEEPDAREPRLHTARQV